MRVCINNKERKKKKKKKKREEKGKGKMSDLVREIVEKLNAPPFEKNLTLIGYGLRRE